MNDSLDSQRYFYVHIMKTAGFSLLYMIKNQVLDRSLVYPTKDERDGVSAYADYAYIRALSDEHKRKYRMFSGHLPFCAREVLGTDLRTIVFLREPVARSISNLKHVKQRVVPYRNWSMEELYNDRSVFQPFVNNHQVRVFALKSLPQSGNILQGMTLGPADYEHALENLNRADFIGLSDDFEDSVRMLETFTGWRFRKTHRINKSPEYEVPENLPERIRQDNDFDVRFYEYAKKLYAERKAKWLAKHGKLEATTNPSRAGSQR